MGIEESLVLICSATSADRSPPNRRMKSSILEDIVINMMVVMKSLWDGASSDGEARLLHLDFEERASWGLPPRQKST